MSNLFDTNDFEKIKIEHFQNSNIYILDNFYKNPEEILHFLLHVKEPDHWKKDESPSFNGLYFLDVRHSFYNEHFTTVGTSLAKITGQTALAPGTIKTNCIKFFDRDFNDYKNNYWGPHRDLGYTALIYFNKKTTYTNIYEQLENDYWNTPEHFAPWRSKTKYKIIRQLEGKFNRLIMFDGAKFLHGMDISNDDFFLEFRINQVLFMRAE